MKDSKKTLQQNAGLRVAGLFLVLAGGFGLKLLYQVVNLPPAHEATITEMIVAAASFLSVTSGAALSVLRAHIFDPVTLSARWANPPDKHIAIEQNHTAPTRSSNHVDDSAPWQHRTGT